MTEPVVVGIDGSPESLAAAEWAGHEAVRRHLPVYLLNVWQNPAGNVRFSPDPEGLRMWEESRLHEAAKRLSEEHPALAVRHEQIPGTPMRVLLDAAAASETLVIGSHGLGGISGFFYGSVGLHALARCDRPVVAVRAAAAQEESPEDGRVVLALDVNQPCDDLTAFAFEEAATRRTALRAVTVWNGHGLYGYMEPVPDPRLASELRAAQGHALVRTLEPWRDRFPTVEVKESVIEGPVAQRLVEVGRGAALLAVGRRRRHPPVAARLGPVAHAVLHHAACPVAVVSHD